MTITLKKHEYLCTIPYLMKVSEETALEKLDSTLASQMVHHQGYYENWDGMATKAEKFGVLEEKNRALGRYGYLPNCNSLIINDLLGREVPGIMNSTDYNDWFSVLSKVFPKMTETLFSSVIGVEIRSRVLDEKNLYRLFALNEFFEHAAKTETYGNFVKNNHADIMARLLELDLSQYAHTKKIMTSFKKSSLQYFDRSAKKNDELFNGMIAQRLYYVLENGKYFDSMNPANYTKNLRKMVDYFSVKQDYSKKDIEKKLTEVFVLSLQKHPEIYDSEVSIAELFQDFAEILSSFGVASKNTGFDNNPAKKMELLSKILEHVDDISPVDILCLLWSISIKNTAFRSADAEKSLQLVLMGLNSIDPVGFVKTVTETILDYDGSILSFTEWKDMLNAEDQSFTLSPDLFVPIFLKSGNLETQRYFTVFAQEIRRKYKGKFRY